MLKAEERKSVYRTKKELECRLEAMDLSHAHLRKAKEILKNELERYREELARLRALPLSLGQYVETIDDNYSIVSSSNTQTLLVRVMRGVNRELLKPNSTVCLHRLSSSITGVIPPELDSEINAASNAQNLLSSDANQAVFAEIGGYDAQKREIREALLLPLEKPELYQKIGIDPPKGVLMYGPPGTGKTLMARTVAAQSSVPFIKVVASEFLQKYLGEGARMIRDVFRFARDKAPAIIFIDEIDAIGGKRFDSQFGADLEVQRILIELLTQMDGFDKHSNVKVIMATNRIDILDPALLRPGRLDRKIEFGYPDSRQKRLVFQVYTKKMTLSNDVDIDNLAKRPYRISGADVRSICQEAGMRAIRDNRYRTCMKDFEEAFEYVTRNISTRNESGGGQHSFYK